MNQEKLLLEKLDQFIRKYYRNKIVRGSLIAASFLTFTGLLLLLAEYFFLFDPVIRSLLLLFFVGFSAFEILILVFIPFLNLLKIGKRLDYEDAARIIGTHFSEIQDKLLNTLQLMQQKTLTEKPAQLLIAGIEQRIATLKIFSFSDLIEIKRNLKYLQYLFLPVLALVFLGIFSPSVIKGPANRLLHFSQEFKRPEKFRMIILNKKLEARQLDDFELRLKGEGENIPAEIFIETEGSSYKLKKETGFKYSYVFKTVQYDLNFKLKAGEWSSETYKIKVFPKPTILHFSTEIIYPEYTKKKNELLENIGDLLVPEGSVIKWSFYTKDVDRISLKFFEKDEYLAVKENAHFFYQRKVKQDEKYSIIPGNLQDKKADSLKYEIKVLKDGFPTITVNEAADSTNSEILSFQGNIKDDYGFSKLNFNYLDYFEDDTVGKTYKISGISINQALNNQSFYYQVNLDLLFNEPGKKVKYFFEVWDNDGIYGPKSTKSQIKIVQTPGIAEIRNNLDQTNNDVKDELSKGIKEIQKAKKSWEEINRKLFDQTSISWKEKRQLEEILRNYNKLENQIEQIRKKSKESIQNEEKFLETSERIIEKQKQLAELMEQLLNDEMKKMIQELKDLLNQIDKTKLNSLMEKMKSQNEDLEKQMDRSLELFKNLEIERKIDELARELLKNAEDQEKIAETLKNKEIVNDSLKDQQKSVGNKSDSASRKISSLKNESTDPEKKETLENAEKLNDSINRLLEDIDKNLGKENSQKTEKKQRNAAKMMKELSQNLSESLEESEEEQTEEDMGNLRMILENLLRLSFKQEEIIWKTKTIARNDPSFMELLNDQKEIKDKIEIIGDSLDEVAKRQVFIKPVISRELKTINSRIENSLEALDSRNMTNAASNQQFSMTSMNNLALLLAEALENMENQMSMSGQGKQKSCKKPSSSGKKGSLKNLKSMQKKLGEQIEKMKNGMEKMKQSEKGMQSKNGQMNEQIAKMAAEQEAIRNELQKIKDALNEKGMKEASSMNQAIKDMEQIENDLLNKRISQETMNRQNRIMSRLLESEKAEQEQEQEETRESTEAKSQKTSNPLSEIQYNIKIRKDFDNLQLVVPEFTPFYKGKVNNYLIKIE